MNRRQILWVASAVVVLHALLFWLISGTRPLPKVTSRPPPNFVEKHAQGVDPETGEAYVYREFRVSTKLALPDVLMQPQRYEKP